MKVARGLMFAVGIASTAMAVYGLWYNLQTLFMDFSNMPQEYNISYFYPAFYTMSAICIAWHIILLICGVQFIRFRANLLKLFIGVIILETIHFFSIGIFWAVPRVSMGVEIAIVSASAGLLLQIRTLFILWAPVLAIWATRKLNKTKVFKNEFQRVVNSHIQPLTIGAFYSLAAITGLLTAAGIIFLSITLFSLFSRSRLSGLNDIEGPYTAQFFWAYVFINLVFLVFLAKATFRLFVKDMGGISLLSLILKLELIYWLVISSFWGLPHQLGQSAACATGIGNMGLSPQVFVAYPITGLIAIWILKWRGTLKIEQGENTQPVT